MARSTLPKDEARRRYVDIGVLESLEQIRRDSRALDASAIPVGPFSRLTADAVAARDGKTRGAITNLFGSQAAFQTETMTLALSVGDWIDDIELPPPSAFASAEDWVDALLTGQSERGPQHGAEPDSGYAYLWALWLSTVPYGLWSEEVSAPSMEEHVLWVRRLATAVTDALEHFGLSLREDTTPSDVASALASIVEGVWLNQCLTSRHPIDSSEPISTALVRAGRMIWRGSVVP